MKKIILTDIDGVMLDWVSEFDNFLKETKGWEIDDEHTSYDISVAYGASREEMLKLIHEYNHSDYMKNLSPLRDSVDGVAELRARGYEFHAITSFTNDLYAKQRRIQNLDDLFGRYAVTRLVCLEMGAGKRKILEEYKDSNLFWLEDLPANADEGLELGLRSILISHSYNQEYKGDAPRVDSWAEIIDIIEN